VTTTVSLVVGYSSCSEGVIDLTELIEFGFFCAHFVEHEAGALADYAMYELTAHVASAVIVLMGVLRVLADVLPYFEAVLREELTAFFFWRVARLVATLTLRELSSEINEVEVLVLLGVSLLNHLLREVTAVLQHLLPLVGVGIGFHYALEAAA